MLPVDEVEEEENEEVLGWELATAATRDERRLRLERSSPLAVEQLVCST